MAKRLSLEQTLSSLTLDRLGKGDFYSIEKSWLKYFCGEHKSKHGKYFTGGFRWNALGESKTPFLEEDQAVEAYKNEIAIEYYVFPESGEGDFVLVLKEKPPVSMLEEYRDFYVFPKNMAWTMAFTHEYGWIGPYFVKNENYIELNKKNIQAVNARKRGWV